MDRQKTGDLLLELLAKHISIQEMIDQIAVIMQNPVILADNRFRILYASTNYDVNIDLWKNALSEGYISDEILKFMEDKQTIEQLKTSPAPSFTTLPNGYQAIRLPLFQSAHYCGFLGIYEYLHPLTEDELDMLSLIQNAITAILYTEKGLQGLDENLYESFLFQLLECQSREQAELVCKKNSPISFGNRKVLICLTPASSHNQNIPFEYLKELLQQEQCTHHSLIFDDKLTILLEREKISDMQYQAFIDRLPYYCKRYQLIAGVSYETNDTKHIPRLYEQAVASTAFSSSSKTNFVFFFDQLVNDILINDCKALRPEGFYRHPYLQFLMDYDAEYNLEYIRTLKIYLCCFRNGKTTADLLGIHYNTVKYRIAAMENLLHCDLRSDDQLCQQLILSLLIDDLV